MAIEFLMNSKGLTARHKEEESRCDSPLEIFSRIVGGLNFLRGLFLFITFCCKTQVWNLVLKSCGRQKRPTMTGRSVPKLNIKDATTVVSGSSRAKEEQDNSDEGMLSFKLPAMDNLTDNEGAKDQLEKLGNQGHNVNLFCSHRSPEATDSSREILNTGTELKNLDEITSTGVSQSVSTLANSEQSVETAQDTTCDAPNHHGATEKNSDVGSCSPVALKKERRARCGTRSRWTKRFSTSPSEWGPGWVRSLRLRMEVGK